MPWRLPEQPTQGQSMAWWWPSQKENWAVDDADGVEEVGGGLLVPAGLGLGPQAARSSSDAAAVVVTSPVLMR